MLPIRVRTRQNHKPAKAEVQDGFPELQTSDIQTLQFKGTAYDPTTEYV